MAVLDNTDVDRTSHFKKRCGGKKASSICSKGEGECSHATLQNVVAVRCL